MTANETKLISLIRNHENPAEALTLATQILISVIKPNATVEEPSAVVPRKRS